MILACARALRSITVSPLVMSAGAAVVYLVAMGAFDYDRRGILDEAVINEEGRARGP